MSAAQAPSSGVPRIRLGGPQDVDWAMSLAPELAGFGLPPWRTYDVFIEECRSSIRAGLEGGDPGDVVFVATKASGEPVGLAHVLLRLDRNTGMQAVVINDLVVESGCRGRGVGSLLMARCEQWADEHEAGALVLTVFQANVGARRFYARNGFQDDIVRVVRSLPPHDPDAR